jgi:hypothetical protein
MLTMLARSILIGALLLSAARAQPAPLPAEAAQLAPIYIPEPTMIPVPPNGCVWAGRSFSDGAGFCIADKVMQVCATGRWARESGSEGCHGAISDTK